MYIGLNEAPTTDSLKTRLLLRQSVVKKPSNRTHQTHQLTHQQSSRRKTRFKYCFEDPTKESVREKKSQDKKIMLKIAVIAITILGYTHASPPIKGNAKHNS